MRKPDTEREALDAYYTPDDAAQAIVRMVHGIEPITGTVWEPHAGAGAFVRALLEHTTATVWGSDISGDAKSLSLVDSRYISAGVGDFLEWSSLHPDWIIGNPPFKAALNHVEHGLRVTRRHLVFLLRLAFLESVRRDRLFAQNPPRMLIPLVQRPAFVCGKTDSAAYAVFWWDRQWQEEAMTRPAWERTRLVMPGLCWKPGKESP